MIKNIYTGAIYGISTWLIYGIIEGLFSIILPWFIKPHYEYIQLHSGFTALLFVLYPIIGLTIGGLIGFGISITARTFKYLQKVQLKIFFPSIAMLTLVLIFDLNFVVNSSGSLGLSEFPPLAISLLLVCCLLLSSFSYKWFIRFRFITNPWTAIILLIGLPWINNAILINYPVLIKALGVFFYLVLILLISFVIHTRIERRQIRKSAESVSAFPGRPLIRLIPLVLLILGINIIFKQTPFRENLNMKSSSLLADKPNVILIVMDTVRADHLSLYGYERDTTPNLRKLAQEATLYTNSIASSDMTLSTHGSIFTGLYARGHGAHFDPPDYKRGRPLPDKNITMAETLSEKGFLTMGVAANKPYLSHRFLLHQGFQYYNNRSPVLFLGKSDFYYLRQAIRNIMTFFASPTYIDQTFRRAEDINGDVFKLLNVLKKGMPSFLFINYMDAHDPYVPPPPFDTMYPGKAKNFRLARYRQIGKEVMKLGRKLTEQEYNHLVSQYDGGIAYIDFHIGELIARLKKLGLYENSLIIITSDHGEVFGKRELLYHGVSVYQDQIHIPLIIKYPDINKRLIDDKVVSVVDLMPTVMDVLGYGKFDGMHGQSLLKLKSEDKRIVLSESFINVQKTDLHPRFDRIERAILSWPYKYIRSTAGKRELYDLSKNPNEEYDLYNTDNNISNEIETKLNKWLKSVEPVHNGTDQPVKLDKQTIDLLKSLGYTK